MDEINEKWRKGCCECCDEQVGEMGFSGHKCKETGCSFLILYRGWEDELVAFLYHEETENEESGKDLNVQDLRDKVGELEKCEAQLTKLGEKLKNKERTRKRRTVEKNNKKEKII